MTESPSVVQSADSYRRTEMIALLSTAARIDRSPPAAAATHLLTYTDLPGRQSFASHVDVHAVREGGGSMVTGAWIRDWDALLGDRGVSLNSTTYRLIELAASYATGRPVDLRNTIGYFATELDPWTAQRIAEAAVIAAAYDETLIVARRSRSRRWPWRLMPRGTRPRRA